jgi:tetratricopeptide (TPR) repeat protein
VSLRDGGIRALLGGSIQEIGGVYAMTVKLIDPVSGVTVTSWAEEARDRQEVLPAIRRLARHVRAALGESLAAIAKSEQHLERVTTPSLEALEFYSKGWGFLNRFDWGRARIFFEQASERDPNFAMSYVGLGYAHLWLGRLEESRAAFTRAAPLAEGVTDREKYFILGSQAAYGWVICGKGSRTMSCWCTCILTTTGVMKISVWLIS